MKVSIRIPEDGPFGETFFDARLRAMVAASFLNNPRSGYVDSVSTAADTFVVHENSNGSRSLCASLT